MRNFTREKVEQLYNKAKTLAKESMRKGKWNDALNRIDLAANIAYTFNFKFKDDDLEEMLIIVSKDIFSDKTLFKPKTDRFVFYDSFGFSNRGLVHQYIRSLMSWDVEFLYILGLYDKNNSSILLQEIENYPKSKILIVDRSIPKTEQIKYIYNQISTYKPDKAFLYMNPWDVVGVTTFNSLTNIIKYQINLTDHAFWLGTRCLDYSIEFRNFGSTVSEQKRGIAKENIFLQPFYPIVIPSKFLGFPSVITSENVVIFSGGNYYKIYGDNCKFFIILKRILDENPNVIILFAGWGEDKPIKQFIKENLFEKRILLLGFRTDINELFAHCDIYLGTYPISGGLMSQYAALNGKPILAYTSDLQSGGYIEDFVLQHTLKTSLKLTHTNLNDFFEEAKKLIENKKYREKIGGLLKESLINPTQFNDDLYQIITNNKSHEFKTEFINYDKIVEQNLEIENKYQNSFEIVFFSRLGFSAIWLFPSISLRLIPRVLIKYRKLLVKKLVKKIS